MRSLGPVTALLTSVGNDGFPAVLNALRHNGERDVRVVAVDVRSDAPGLYLADRGELVPPRSEPDALVARLLQLCAEEAVALILPLSTEDQVFFAQWNSTFADNGVGVVVSSLSATQTSNNKLRLMEFAEANAIPHPHFLEIRDAHELPDGARALGYPDSAFVLKLNSGTGSQGVKIVHPRMGPHERMFDRNNINVTYHEVEAWLAGMEHIPPMHLVEYLPGAEYSVDVLCRDGEVLRSVVRHRERTLYGLALSARVVQDDGVASVAEACVQRLGLSYTINVQVRRDTDGAPKLMEINPRIPGTIGLTVAAGVNMPYLSFKLALNEPFEVPEIRFGTTIFRFWDAKYIHESQRIR